MVKSQRYQTGFTLMEIVIVSFLIALFGLAIYSTFRNGILVWSRAQQKGVKCEESIIFLERLSKELRSSFRSDEIGVKGEKIKISFPALLSELYPIERSDEQMLVQKPGRITYQWDEDKGIITCLEEDYSAIFHSESELASSEILKGIKEMTLNYQQPSDKTSSGFEWVEEWDKSEVLPRAVRIRIKWGESDDEKIIRTIFIPTAF